MNRQNQIPNTAPANQNEDASGNVARIHPVFEIYPNSLPCRIKHDGWWLEERSPHPSSDHPRSTPA